jgi:hypothetical protein
MRRWLAYMVAVLLVAATAIAIVIAAGSRHNTDNKSTVSSSTTTGGTTSGSIKKACRVFTLADAKQLLGDSAKGGQNPVIESSSDIEASTCTYTQDEGTNAPVSSGQAATVLVRTPKTTKGATSNQEQFGQFKPIDVQDVSGYGDSAYWDAEHGQLDILKNSNWYILSYGPIVPASRTLEQTRQLADILINKM